MTLKRKLLDEIDSRNRRRGLSTSWAGMIHLNNYLYKYSQNPRSILYIGSGHGLDLWVRLADMSPDDVDRIVCIDPFIEADGNGASERKEFLEFQRDFVRKGFNIELIPEVFSEKVLEGQLFDLIIVNDVLHHIFWESDLKVVRNELEQFFKEIHNLLCEEGVLVVGEVTDFSLQSLVHRVGLFTQDIDYATKHRAALWIKFGCVEKLFKVKVEGYCPYILKRRFGFSIRLANKFLFQKYFIFCFR